MNFDSQGREKEVWGVWGVWEVWEVWGVWKKNIYSHHYGSRRTKKTKHL
ncbi:MAG: hypothetical protein QNJ74_07765 [Trichodesmium sp. MO_231.B1]|nr:hypothetical protein [Trichodesmium sp. MO_231.B1]